MGRSWDWRNFKVGRIQPSEVQRSLPNSKSPEQPRSKGTAKWTTRVTSVWAKSRSFRTPLIILRMKQTNGCQDRLANWMTDKDTSQNLIRIITEDTVNLINITLILVWELSRSKAEDALISPGCQLPRVRTVELQTWTSPSTTFLLSTWMVLAVKIS